MQLEEGFSFRAREHGDEPRFRHSNGTEIAEEMTFGTDGHAELPSTPEPTRASVRYFRGLLVACAQSGASDVTLQSDQQPRGEFAGRLYRLGRRPWSPSEIEEILAETYHATNGITEIKGRRVLDYSYELNLPNGTRRRFRVNATGILGLGGSGVEITIRILPSSTPTTCQAGLSAGEVEELCPMSGLVVIAGATGSGKSATMAALTRHHLENSIRPVKIVDIQAPIEYSFGDVIWRSIESPSLIGQSEVGRHIASFAAGVRSALRRKPHIICVGEARDLETISATLEAALTGHLVYTTTHAANVPDCIRRLLAAFPAGEREQRAIDLGSSLRFVMVQHLVPLAEGNGRLPAREYVSVSGSMREALGGMHFTDWPAYLHSVMSGPEAGRAIAFRQSLSEAAEKLLADGRVNGDELGRLLGTAR